MGGAVPQEPHVGLAGQRPWPVARRTPSAHPQQRTMRASSVRTPRPAGPSRHPEMRRMPGFYGVDIAIEAYITGKPTSH